jgi:hypothetical protein
MNLQEFRELLDHHGSDSSGWPEALRAQALQLTLASVDAARELATARRLDDTMRQADHIVTPGLGRRIKALAQTRHDTALDQFVHWLISAFWRPVLLSVVPLLLGTLLGTSLPVDQAPDEALNMAGMMLDEVYIDYE